MKRSVTSPMISYLMFSKNVQRGIIKSTVNQYENISKRKYTHIKNTHRNHLDCIVLNKIILDPLKTNSTNFQAKRCNSTEQKHKFLMDFEVKHSLGLFELPKVFLLSYNVRKKFDGRFDLLEFYKESKKALVVVCELLWQKEFTKLKGLLTEECRSEVIKNVMMMNDTQLSTLKINVDNIFVCFPCDFKMEDEYLEICMVYHCQGKELDYKYQILIFNVVFFRNFGSENDNSWTIKAINVTE